MRYQAALRPDKIALLILPNMIAMKKNDIAKHIARKSRVTEAEAADRLDRLVHQILSNLRKGRETSLPGLGKFVPGPDGRAVLKPEEGDHRD